MTRAELIRTADAVPFRLGGWSGLRRRELEAADLAQALSQHEQGAGTSLKDDARSRVMVADAGGATVVVKEVRKAGLRRRLADVFRGSAAHRAFAAGHRLRDLGIGVALPLAYVEETRVGFPLRSLLVSRDLRVFPTAAEVAANDPERAVLLLCELVLKLHRERVVHGDLRAQHVHLCGPDPVASLIDLEGVRIVGGLSEDVRMEALSQLNASLPDEIVSVELRDQAYERYVAEMPFRAGESAARARIIQLSRARQHLWRGEACASR